MSIRNHCAGGCVRRVSPDIVHILENSLIELQRMLVQVDVFDGVASKIGSEQERVLVLSSDERIAVSTYQNSVALACYQCVTTC